LDAFFSHVMCQLSEQPTSAFTSNATRASLGTVPSSISEL
jgi:hypothetical protein